MAARCIIPVEPANDAGDVVVVEVQQEGSRPFDVRLVGCEGESPYVAHIKHRNIGKLKHKFKGTDDEWETILSHFLLQKQPGGTDAGTLEHIRMVYTLKGDNIEISIRQDVEGIKVTLGEIVLPREDEFEFNPFEWAQASAQAHSQTLHELAQLKARVSSEQDTIAKLKSQLDDFVEAKNEAETAMLQQFMELLNEKKRKIRDQSRLLAGAKVDKATASTVRSARETTKPRKAGASRPTKRKTRAGAAAPEEPQESEHLSDADQMEIDQAKAEEQDDEEEPAATPDRTSDEETEAEDEGAETAEASSAPQRPERSSETVRSQSTVRQASEDVQAKSAGPPPKRELPFGRPATRRKALEKKPPAPPAGDEEDETEDEEL